jgi:hypothetical protein
MLGETRPNLLFRLASESQPGLTAAADTELALHSFFQCGQATVGHVRRRDSHVAKARRVELANIGWIVRMKWLPTSRADSELRRSGKDRPSARQAGE